MGVAFYVEEEGVESDGELFEKLCRRRREEDTRALDEAKREAEERGKEPFDLEVFEQLYSYDSPVGTRQERMAMWERDYYVWHRSVTSITEFVEAVNRRELYDGGDMHLESLDTPGQYRDT